MTSFPEGIVCGTACTASFPAGSTVTLGTANTILYGQHRSWGGACERAEAFRACSLTMDGAKEVIAEFRHMGFVWLTLSSQCVSGSAGRVCGAAVVRSDTAPVLSCGTANGVQSTCGVSYLPGTAVTLRPELTRATDRVTWTGCTAVSGNACLIAVVKDRNDVTIVVTPP